MSKIVSDPRIDPRIKALMGMMPSGAQPDIANREELLAEANTPDALAMQAACAVCFDSLDNEDVAPSTGLTVTDHTSSSRSPTATRSRSSSSGPTSTEPLPCVYYIHGGGMQTMSCFDGMYRAWGRIIAAQGVAVAMVDFRNALVAVVGAGGRAVPGRPQRLRLRAEVGARARRRARHRPRPPHRRRRERRRQPHARHRAEAEARRRHRPDHGPLRALPLHRRRVAAGPDNPSSIENNGILLDLHNNRGAHGLRHRGARAAQPARLARLRRPRTTCAGSARR